MFKAKYFNMLKTLSKNISKNIIIFKNFRLRIIILLKLILILY